MFTGIVTDVGEIIAAEPRGEVKTLTIATDFDPASLALGASIACSGVCLTVVHLAADAFSVDCSAETVGATTVGTWKQGARINLERALRLAPVAVVIPMDYSALLWSIACGWFFFGTFPAETTWIGAPLIIASGLFIAWREHRLHIERTKDITA